MKLYDNKNYFLAKFSIVANACHERYQALMHLFYVLARDVLQGLEAEPGSGEL